MTEYDGLSWATWQRAIDRRVELGKEAAQWEAEWEKQTEMLKTIIAIECEIAEGIGVKGVAAQTNYAYKSKRYIEAVQKKFTARVKMREAQSAIKAADQWFDGIRTLESSRRQEMALAR